MSNEKDDATQRYPQLNLNTGMSVAVVVLVGAMFLWFGGLKSDVSYHEQRITVVEAGLQSLRMALGQSDTKLEGRLTRIEILLQDLLSRSAAGDRRLLPPQQ